MYKKGININYVVTVQTFIARSRPPVARTLGNSGCQSQPVRIIKARDMVQVSSEVFMFFSFGICIIKILTENRSRMSCKSQKRSLSSFPNVPKLNISIFAD